MPAKDIYHSIVRNALEKEGWIVTHDPLRLAWGARDLYVDLGAECLLAAEKGLHKIAVEIKSFIQPSPIADLENALGQYILYHDLLARLEPERKLYLAIRQRTFRTLFEEAEIGRVLLDNDRLRLTIFDPEREEILQWIP